MLKMELAGGFLGFFQQKRLQLDESFHTLLHTNWLLSPIQLTSWQFILIPKWTWRLGKNPKSWKSWAAILAVVFFVETSGSPPNIPHQNGPSVIESHITYGFFGLRDSFTLLKLTSFLENIWSKVAFFWGWDTSHLFLGILLMRI